jgi:ribonuclease P protein subunit POP4
LVIWYFDLNHKNERIVISSNNPFSPKHYVDSITNPTGNPAIKSQYDARVTGKHIHLENPQKESRLRKELKEKRARREKHQARKRLGVMGRREAKLKGVWTLRPEDAK